VFLIAALIANGSDAAEPTRAQTGKGTPAPRPTTSKGGAARGPLPDPTLLDGSSQPAEKKSEYGMIGDFELPGDENAKNGKVGGPQNPGGQQQPPGAQQTAGGGGMPMGLPQGGGAGQQAQQQSGKAGEAGQQAGGGQPQSEQNPNAGGAGDPNAKAEGIQVAQLGGEASGEQPPSAGEKPPPVAIGDSAMRIQTSANTPGVVGGQQIPAANTQQHDKGTGSGGKGPTGAQGPNRVEKGRTIPAGL
jgi:hypothetical protein